MEDRKKQGYFQTSLIRWLAAEGCSGSGIYPSGITEKQNGNKEGITKCRTPCLRAGSVSEISYLDFLNINMSTNNGDRKSTRLNSSHVAISYAVFCLKKK